MTMTPSLRKFALAIHLTASVGWIGAVVAYLALVIVAMIKQDAQTMRTTWSAMHMIGWYVIVPASIASLFTGLIMSLGTHWGLLRHYWVLFSLVLTVFATVVLLQHMQDLNATLTMLAQMPSMAVAGLQGELIHSGGGLLVLLVIQVLNVYKPRGMTGYGWRKQDEQRVARAINGIAVSDDAAM